MNVNLFALRSLLSLSTLADCLTARLLPRGGTPLRQALTRFLATPSRLAVLFILSGFALGSTAYAGDGSASQGHDIASLAATATGNGVRVGVPTTDQQGPGRSPGSTSSVLATFNVLSSGGSYPVRWIYSGVPIRSHLGSAVLRDHGGAVVGYRVVPDSGGAVVESRSWDSEFETRHYPFVAYAVALFANNSNPPLAPNSTGMITPGYVPDLGAYHMGSGPGWVAVDTASGNALLLRVVARTVGAPNCGPTGSACLAQGTSALGSMDAIDFAHFVTNDEGFISGFTGAIVSNLPFVGYACSLNPNATTTAYTCLGGDLGVTLTPVGVVRGDVLGVKTSHAGGGSARGGAWSPGGSYSLALTGVSVFN